MYVKVTVSVPAFVAAGQSAYGLDNPEDTFEYVNIPASVQRYADMLAGYLIGQLAGATVSVDIDSTLAADTYTVSRNGSDSRIGTLLQTARRTLLAADNWVVLL